MGGTRTKPWPPSESGPGAVAVVVCPAQAAASNHRLKSGLTLRLNRPGRGIAARAECNAPGGITRWLSLNPSVYWYENDTSLLQANHEQPLPCRGPGGGISCWLSWVAPEEHGLQNDCRWPDTGRFAPSPLCLTVLRKEAQKFSSALYCSEPMNGAQGPPI